MQKSEETEDAIVCRDLSKIVPEKFKVATSGEGSVIGQSD
jgi:hypothetical protein